MSAVRPAGHLSRRHFMQGAGAAAIALLGYTQLQQAPAAGAQTTDFSGLREAWSQILTGAPFDATDSAFAATLTTLSQNARNALLTLDSSATRSSLFTDLPLGTASANVTTSFGRLRDLALAVATPGTDYAGDADVAATAIDGLDFLVAGAYSKAAGTTGKLPGYGNWWDWQIGSPQRLQDTAILLFDRLTPQQVAAYCSVLDYFVVDPAVQQSIAGPVQSTGANRLDLCRVSIVRGALGDDGSKVSLGVQAVTPTLQMVDAGDGLHADYGWVQHTTAGGVGIPYTGTYGEVWLKNVALLQKALTASDQSVDADGLATVQNAALRGFRPFIFDGVMMDAVRGRAISRPNERGWDDGISAAVDVALLGRAAGNTAAGRQLLAVAKGWFERSASPVAEAGSMLKASVAKSLIEDTAVAAEPEPTGHFLFPSLDRAVHRGKGWAVSISLASNRTAYYENGGGDNLRGWHTGNGMTATYLSSASDHYDDDYWPTVDPYRLPGTTASMLPLTDGQGGTYANVHPSSPWAGGTTDGSYAAIGMQLQGPFSTLRGATSWFCLDDAIVCLGSGITARDGAAVATVIDDRIVSAGQHLRVDGRIVTDPRTVRRARLATIDGHPSYGLLSPTDVTAGVRSRTGSWSDIDSAPAYAGLPPTTREHATLYLEHGVDPTDASYGYVLVPGGGLRGAALSALAPGWVRVVSQGATAHAVQVPARGMTAATFWAGGEAGALRASGPCAILVRIDLRTRTATLCVADPTRTAGELTVTWRGPARTVVSSPPGVRAAVSRGRSVTLTLTGLDTAEGATRTVRVGL